jgi:hypothetical protein
VQCKNADCILIERAYFRRRQLSTATAPGAANAAHDGRLLICKKSSSGIQRNDDGARSLAFFARDAQRDQRTPI